MRPHASAGVLAPSARTAGAALHGPVDDQEGKAWPASPAWSRTSLFYSMSPKIFSEQELAKMGVAVEINLKQGGQASTVPGP